MVIKSTVSSKGQVVIPKEIRDVYDLGRNTVVIFEPAGEKIILRPLKTEFASELERKLAKFDVDPEFRKSWEKSLNEKLKKWNW